MKIVRIVIGYVLASVVTLLAASAFHTHMVLGALVAAGAEIPHERRLAMTETDLVGLAPQLGPVIAIGLAIGFLVAAGLKRVIRPLAPVAYLIAGAAAMAVALKAMSLAFDGITPIAGARSTLGFALQCFAGALGGGVFSLVAVRAK